ncbi:hypothetical protein, partial [Nocardia farcinica]|uniref:hypothetical protein n=1 Tax=Nocardia farcinica TaxID=37329 RepID=UPI003CC7E6BD
DRADATIVVPRLRMRPGGSTIVAETNSGTTVLGLPGIPFAAVAASPRCCADSIPLSLLV